MELNLDRYYTLMVIPEKNKNVHSFRIPRLVFRSLIFLSVTFIVLLGILLDRITQAAAARSTLERTK